MYPMHVHAAVYTRECISCCAYQRDISIDFDRKPRTQLSIDHENFLHETILEFMKVRRGNCIL